MKRFYSYFLFLNYILASPLNKDNSLKVIFRIFWWRINQIFFKFPCIVELVPGTKCICYPSGSLYSTLVMYLKFPEYGEMQLLLSILNDKDIFIDVGANIGVYSLLASSKINKGKIFAFEPSPKILPQLEENISLNNKDDRIVVIKKAVSQKNGFINFDINSSPDYNHISYSSNKTEVLRVQSITLDKFISKNNLKRVKLIKIDVEGAELLVLKGLQKSLKAKLVDVLIVEVNQDEEAKKFGFSIEQLFQYLIENGFSLYYFDSGYKLRNFNKRLDGAWNIIAIHKSKIKIISEWI